MAKILSDSMCPSSSTERTPVHRLADWPTWRLHGAAGQDGYAMESDLQNQPDASSPPTATPTTDHVDVVIVGAGISGVGGAYHLKTQMPEKSFIVLETQDNFGGTWRTHTYPGIRSDSDLHTFGYRFKPWTGAPIASAESILNYMGEVIAENGLAPHIRYSHTISNATWSTEDRRWTLTGTRTDTGEPVSISCNFLWMCQGYYRHSVGYTPDWPGMDQFEGTIIHPQTWPENLDLQDKRVLVIGSGATAATLIPAIADKCAHVTMLQRSPTYFIPGRNAIDIAEQLRALEVPEEWVHEIVRRQIIKNGAQFTQRCLEEPEVVRNELLAMVKAFIPDESIIAEHFTPSYRPWRQRVAFIPDGDLFRAIASGSASVVTDQIETFTETGLKTTSGKEIEADIIVTATGFNMSVLGDIAFTVDGKPVDFADTVTYRGTMFTGVPNMLWVFGYLRASWTLRADMLADFVCKLLRHMDDTGTSMVVPALRPTDEGMQLLPWIESENFNSGYIGRSIHLMPKQGDRDPWRHTQDYWTEKDDFQKLDLAAELEFS